MKNLGHRWPAAVGLAAAVFQLGTGVQRETVAVTLSVALLCYLGAAALGRPWVAWAGILGGSVVVVVSELAGLPWWSGVGLTALILVAVGVVGGVPRTALTWQTAAFVGYGGLVWAALVLSPRLGLALAGVALAAHAVWDVIHYRRNQVVARSLAEFCIVLDVPLGIGAIVLAITGS
ncbi:MAG: hypothetical protein HOU81_01510 [Hamadaea sp.]|uniref:hypothetical protein n=1 Tax=Hamadaea sp. TaxID=2024425 RepID=UPI001819F572|nr:hypothetical protein [Hamadaea sp.]NUR69476.1 hypothetical protein [Hamadaea sp.]NUT20712.1 hypothetical protein [Hamadaea sp.]